MTKQQEQNKREFFLSDTLKDLQDSMSYVLCCLANSTTEKEKEYFKKEYARIAKIFNNEMENWIAIW